MVISRVFNMNEKLENIPKWHEIVKMQGAIVTKVNWDMDFTLLDLCNSKDENSRDEAFEGRKRLYSFLKRTFTLYDNGAYRDNDVIMAYKSRVRPGDMDCRIGPSFDGHIYYFKTEGIAKDWIESYKKRNLGVLAFISHSRS